MDFFEPNQTEEANADLEQLGKAGAYIYKEEADDESLGRAGEYIYTEVDPREYSHIEDELKGEPVEEPVEEPEVYERPIKLNPVDPYIGENNYSRATEKEKNLADGEEDDGIVILGDDEQWDGLKLHKALRDDRLGAKPGMQDYLVFARKYCKNLNTLEKLFSADSNVRADAIEQFYKDNRMPVPGPSVIMDLTCDNTIKSLSDDLPKIKDARILFNRAMPYFKRFERALDDQKDAMQYVDKWVHTENEEERRDVINLERQRIEFVRKEGNNIRDNEPPYYMLTERQKEYLLNPRKFAELETMFATEKKGGIFNSNSGAYNAAKSAAREFRAEVDQFNRFIRTYSDSEEAFEEALLERAARLKEKEDRLKDTLNAYIAKVTKNGTKGIEAMDQDAGRARLAGARGMMDFIGGVDNSLKAANAQEETVSEVSFADLYKQEYSKLKDSGDVKAKKHAAAKTKRGTGMQRAHKAMQNAINEAAAQIRSK